MDHVNEQVKFLLEGGEVAEDVILQQLHSDIIVQHAIRISQVQTELSPQALNGFLLRF